MGFFGIGAAIKTGRTASMLEGLSDGDRVYFATAREARRFERLCKERNKNIECIVVDPR